MPGMHQSPPDKQRREVKVVEKLNKESYRRDLWIDNNGGLWFFHWDLQDWQVIVQVPEVWATGFGWTKPQLGYTREDTEYMKGWPDGPFRRVLKGHRP